MSFKGTLQNCEQVPGRTVELQDSFILQNGSLPPFD